MTTPHIIDFARRTDSGLRVHYTATNVVPDGSDTDGYGDGCEPGYGYEIQTGWIDPDWDGGKSVHPEPEDVRADVWTPDDGPMIDWLVARILDRIGLPEDYGDDAHGTYYAGEATTWHDTGIESMRAAHIYGATDSILSAVAYAIDHARRVIRSGGVLARY